MCISFGDVTGHWGFGYSLRGMYRGSADRDIEVDRPYVFPCPMVLFALGIYDVTVQLGSLVNNGLQNVLVICRGLE